MDVRNDFDIVGQGIGNISRCGRNLAHERTIEALLDCVKFDLFAQTLQILSK